jgi:hypothetical protein
MRIAWVLSSVLALGACTANSNGQEARPAASSETIQRSYSVGQFNGVSLAGPHDVIVTVGGAQSVRAEGAAQALEQLEITVKDGTLRIGQRKNDQRGWSMTRNLAKTVIYVSVPSLASAAIGGSGDMRIDRVEGEEFAGSIGGSGSLDIASLRVGSANFSIAGSGGIRAAGTADKTNNSVAGSGDIDLANLQTDTTAVSIVGSGDVRANARRAASVSIMGSGDAFIAGGAQCAVNKMGSGDVRCG